jgi:CubicO group peptidase (beta-lactamase class C family)
MRTKMGAAHAPGGAIAIVLDGKLAFAAGVGVKKSGGSDPVDAKTLFRVGSMSKMVMAATVMSMVDEGKVDVSHPLTEYANTFVLAPGVDAHALTVEQILTHTAGLPDDLSLQCDTGTGILDAWFARAKYPLWAPPGAVWNYSNVDYAAVGLLVEKVGGRALEEEVSARVFAKACMQSATFDATVAEKADHATGHYEDTPGHVVFYEPDAYDCEVLRPPGGVFASVIDYAHFAEAMLAGGGSMLSHAAAATMQAPHVATRETPDEHYGFALFADGYKGLARVQHGGGVNGYISSFWMIPDRRFAVIAFSNSFGFSPEGIAAYATDVFLDLPATKPPSYATSPSTWQDYVGTYQDPYELGTITVAFDNGALTANVAAWGQTLPLQQYAGDTFYSTATSFTFEATFWRGANGVPAYFVTREGVGARVP